MISMRWENLAELVKVFDPAVVGTAVKRAVTTASERVRTQISRDVRARYTVKQGDVGKSVSVRNIMRGATVERLLVYTGSRIGLEKFAMRERTIGRGKGKRRGVSVQVLRTEGRQVVQGAFTGRARTSGAKLVFQRTGDARLPIRKLTGPAIPTMVSNPGIISQASTTATTVMQQEFARQMELLLGKTGGDRD